MMPDLESLRCFAAAAKHLNFRVAARSVGLSPAAFGDRIKRLEDLLEARLFERTTRRVRLTPEGERLLPQALRAIDSARACLDVVSSRTERAPFSITLGTRFELGLSWVTPALRALERARPERQLHLVFGDTPVLLKALHHSEIDCLVTSARITSSDLDYARLHQEDYVFVGSVKLTTERPLSRREHASGHTLLELNADLPLFRYFLDARPAGEVWGFRHTQYLGTIGSVRSRALDGAGVAVLPYYFVEADITKRRLARLMPKVRLPFDWFRLIWRRDHLRQDELRALAEQLSGVPLA